jgi:hypothetical protein
VTRRIRIELDEPAAKALHAALKAALTPSGGRARRRRLRGARGRPARAEVQPSDRECPSAGCDGKATWLVAKGRSATWKALTRDGSVTWTCPKCSRTWVIYLQAHDDDGAPAYRSPVDGDHNRPYWRSSR